MPSWPCGRLDRGSTWWRRPDRAGRAVPDIGSGHSSGAVRSPRRREQVPGFGRSGARREARRALEIALAGGHGLLLIGPPGSGKTLLARTVPGLLPPLDDAAALAVSIVASAAGEGPLAELRRQPPFRAPHHTISYAAMVGGGPRLSPGEVSLADHGVLFLDELPEFDRDVLEALRQPLEDGRVAIARAGRTTTFPARFQLHRRDEPVPVRVRGRRTTATALHVGPPIATSGGSRGRCATGSTSRSRCRVSLPAALVGPSPRRRWSSAVVAARTLASARWRCATGR